MINSADEHLQECTVAGSIIVSAMACHHCSCKSGGTSVAKYWLGLGDSRNISVCVCDCVCACACVRACDISPVAMQQISNSVEILTNCQTVCLTPREVVML